ncbi:MAG: preprotein translocase subunit YajC [Phycisphaeraceae bacterium]|nr:preprotein translocase subunit YajC [Phycisphaerales bacterium]MCB9861366.1 preprotein translocase subunit YajC [Phycisphaeraceae bacterium]
MSTSFDLHLTQFSTYVFVPPVGVMQTSGIGPSDGAGAEVAPVTSQPSSTSPQNGGQPTGNPFGPMIWIIPIMLILLMVMSGGGQRKERKQRQTMLGSLGKHDVVQTTGGIIGTISEIRDNEVLLKIDEASPSRVRFAKSSIQHVIRSHASKSDAPKEVEIAAAS